MKRIVVNLAIMALPWCPAWAWSHGGRWGGSMSHSFGDTSHTSRWGTSASHVAGEGVSHSNVYGGSTTRAYGEGTTHTSAYGTNTAHYYGGGASHTNVYGGTTYGGYDHYSGGYYGAYHPPTTVNHYYGAGCYECGGWAAGAAAMGAAVGMTAGAVSASAAASSAASSAAATNANAYSAGYAAGSAASPTYVMGGIYTTLPAGCASPDVQGQTYYLCGNTWFSPSYGANGVYHRVVPTP